ncbi:tRNA pseudouridine synthase B [Caldimicrobium thiodismutans]|uniref:tRNA pseudouridine synthase B n=1 Tax=Caldimicrobium thiodismutans TaxID=1653476 RepID=A0A0U5AEU2_9BACT|nr:tRNA pseudouridine synthase B [Caldimicrobium thiodismutans]
MERFNLCYALRKNPIESQKIWTYTTALTKPLSSLKLNYYESYRKEGVSKTLLPSPGLCLLQA